MHVRLEQSSCRAIDLAAGSGLDELLLYWQERGLLDEKALRCGLTGWQRRSRGKRGGVPRPSAPFASR